MLYTTTLRVDMAYVPSTDPAFLSLLATGIVSCWEGGEIVYVHPDDERLLVWNRLSHRWEENLRLNSMRRMLNPYRYTRIGQIMRQRNEVWLQSAWAQPESITRSPQGFQRWLQLMSKPGLLLAAGQHWALITRRDVGLA